MTRVSRRNKDRSAPDGRGSYGDTLASRLWMTHYPHPTRPYVYWGSWDHGGPLIWVPDYEFASNMFFVPGWKLTDCLIEYVIKANESSLNIRGLKSGVPRAHPQSGCQVAPSHAVPAWRFKRKIISCFVNKIAGYVCEFYHQSCSVDCKRQLHMPIYFLSSK